MMKRGYRDNEHKLKREVQAGCKEKIFHHEVIQGMEQVSQAGCGVPTFGRVQDPAE